MPRLLLLAFLLAASSLYAAPADDGKTVLCFVGHKTSHGFMKHEYLAGSHLIAEWLEAAYPEANIEARFAVPWPEDEETFFKDADTVVFFCSGGGGHVVNKHVAEFDKVMRTGAGLACLHYGVEVPIGPSAKGMLNWMGGYFEANWSVNPHWVAEFETFGDHPATRGVKPFKIDDEWYFHMRFVEGMKGVDPILSAVAPAETMSRKDGAHSGNPAVRKAVAAGEPQHVAWAYQRGEDYNNGRGFGFTGLHYHWNWEEDSFRKAALNGIAWTAQLEIPENGIETPTPSREFLEANALKHGGAQGAKPKTAAASTPASKPLFESPILRHSNPPSHSVAIDVAIPDGSKELALVISDAGDGVSHDWAAWAEPRLVMADGSEKKLTDLEWKASRNGFGNINKNANCRGGNIMVKGQKVEYGIGAHASATVVFDLPKGVKRFKARGVLDDGGTVRGGEKTTPTSVQFLVFNQAAGVADGAQKAADDYVKKSTAPGRDADEAIASLEVHPDLDVQLFASEPMITSPSSIDIDAKGRVWVCDVVNYRRNQGKREGGAGDQILILEDTDGDARADKKTVFYQGHDVDSAHGICVLGDRVIISCGDEVFSLYDRDGDGVADPDSKKVMFTNIGGAQHDHGIHALHFGPDGRLYFNFGNAGKRLCDPEGNLITDINGIKCTNENNRPYQEGMVFRCDLEGNNVELLAWNFRNNWEIAVDSFGTVWQSDNDDDGNKAVRINYVMEYGNFGYKDEVTGSGWRDPRIGMADEIPERHWHQNDPGVVPNLLVTGAGSPTGICVYEGTLLPEIFRGQLIHCDAGPNVVRSYITEPDGAGYKVTKTVDLIRSTEDRWFRPSDVCVAPDGSLFVADWYDPGVGGRAMGDIEKGRIFRLIPKGNKHATRYHVPPTVTVGVASKFKHQPFTLLGSPNESSRYDAWQGFAKAGKEAGQWLSQSSVGAFNEGNDPRIRARALWQLAKTNPKKLWSILYDPKDAEYLSKADSDLRVTALRALRQHAKSIDDEILWDLADPDAAFHRELAIATRFETSDHSDQIWAGCMRNADIYKDRWYLEALGIGADLDWDKRLAAFHQHQVAGKTYQPIVWRSRASQTAGQLAALILDREKHNGIELKPVGGKVSHHQALRALSLLPDQDSLNLAWVALFREADPESALYAAGKIGPDAIAKLDGGQRRLDALLAPIRGTAEFVRLAERLNLRDFDDELANYIGANPNTSEAVTAARMLLRNRRQVLAYLHDVEQVPRAEAIVSALGKTGERSLEDLLTTALTHDETPAALKPALINAMAGNGRAGQKLLALATDKNSPLDASLKNAAALAFARSPDKNLREAAARRLPVPIAAGADNFPPLAELVKMKGDPKKGATMFATATCNTCHKVRGEGIDFGPDLSEIGNKLGRDALFERILYPSTAISHGFHGVSIATKDGSALVGYVTGETDKELQLRLPGGVDRSLPLNEIATRSELDVSLMPPGLAAIIGAEGLADLVSYLQSLK